MLWDFRIRLAVCIVCLRIHVWLCVCVWLSLYILCVVRIVVDTEHRVLTITMSSVGNCNTDYQYQQQDVILLNSPRIILIIQPASNSQTQPIFCHHGPVSQYVISHLQPQSQPSFFQATSSLTPTVPQFTKSDAMARQEEISCCDSQKHQRSHYIIKYLTTYHINLSCSAASVMKIFTFFWFGPWLGYTQCLTALHTWREDTICKMDETSSDVRRRGMWSKPEKEDEFLLIILLLKLNSNMRR